MNYTTKDNLISRLENWKFGQAQQYKKALKHEESVDVLNKLDALWGNTGWTGTTSKVEECVMCHLVRHLVNYIVLLEGWTPIEWE